jgi:hypothetical protein
LLGIIALALFWYGLIPVLGAFVNRHGWRVFRRSFDDFRLRPFLDYAAYRRGEGGSYRFIGGFESVTGGHTLWIRNDELTIPVSLSGAHTYVLPTPENNEAPWSFDPGKEAPARIHWDRVTALTEGAKVFVGGLLLLRDDRLTCVSRRDNPLLVIFYDGSDRSLTARTIRAGRHGNEYWNILTPYAFILGAFSQIVIALNFLQRPAFRFTVLVSLVAVFIPLLPLVPPGFILTVLYRRLWWQARVFRAYRDLVRLPLKDLPPDMKSSRLPDGELYGVRRYETLPPGLEKAIEKREISLLIPGKAADKFQGWYVFGAFPEGGKEGGGKGEPGLHEQGLCEPRDPFATYGVIPGNPEELARSFTVRAYVLEIISWILLLMGLSLNIFFIGMIIFLLS